MMKLLHFSGPCSFATFLATAGDGILQVVRFVRTLEKGEVVCFLDLTPLDDAGRAAVGYAIGSAHAVEPVRLDHDVTMTPATLAFVVNRLANVH